QQPPPQRYQTYQPTYEYREAPRHTRRRHRHERWRDVFSPSDVSIVVGGGGVDFMSEDLSSLVHPGPMWNARVTVGARSWLALEAAYVGTMNKLIGPNASEPHVMSNGFESDLRINFWPGRVEPYAFGGVGYAHWNLHNRDRDPVAAALFRDSDDQLVVPAGAGLSGYFGNHFLLDTRFTYRALFNQNFVLINERRNDQWTVQANLGVAF
ncbi:MAG TPA: hypothetical protein VFF06_02440, partial [Polyangia bacterium]|nr:hypothetical protein [Polyangia bacterium]